MYNKFLLDISYNISQYQPSQNHCLHVNSAVNLLVTFLVPHDNSGTKLVLQCKVVLLKLFFNLPLVDDL